MKKLAFLALLAIVASAAGVQAQVIPQPGPPVPIGCAYNTSPPTLTNGQAGWVQCDNAGKLQVNASVSASISGFHQETVLTPFSATTLGASSGAFTAGKTIIVSNVGSTNTAYCQLGLSSSTSSQPIPPQSWIALTSTSETAVNCSTSTSTTTMNVSVGTGIPTGAGGGTSSGGGGGGPVYGPTANGSPAANPPVLIGGTSNGTGTGNVANATIKAGNTVGTTDPAIAVADPNLLAAAQAGVASVGATFPASAIGIGGKDGSGNIQPPVMSNYGTAPGASPAIGVNNNQTNRLGGLLCDGCTASYGSATGTTAATSATLAATASVTQYVCGFSIRANATAAATGNATLSDGTKTYNFTQWTAPLASGLGVVEEVFPGGCRPASAVNTAWTLTSAAPGSGGTVSVTIWGFYK